MKHLMIVLIFNCIFFSSTLAQNSFQSKSRIGVAVGYGSEQLSLFNNPSYTYTVQLNKLQLYYTLKDDSWGFDLLLQPEYNISHYQLLNRFFVNPDEQTPTDLDKQRVNEYVLNLGAIIRKRILPSFSVYFLLSIGPAFLDHGTSRQAKGFTFSDNIFLGTTLRLNSRLFLDARYGFRHISNADTRFPNSGYNSAIIETGLSYKLKSSPRKKKID